MSKKSTRPRTPEEYVNGSIPQQGSPSQEMRDRTYHKWLDYIERIAISRYKWCDLPETISERFLESTLLYSGLAVFFKEPLTGNLMATEVMLDKNSLNVYGDPTKFTSTSSAMASWRVDLDSDSGVIVYDSLVRRFKWPVLEYFAEDLAEIDVQARQNRRQQKNATIFVGPEEKAGDLSRLAAALERNDNAVIGTKGLVENTEIKSISTGITYQQKEFHADRTATLAQLYSALGIENIGFEKSERLLKVEAGIASDSVARIREDGLVPRQLAAEAINKLFGTNITVEWRDDLYEELNGATTADTPDENKEQENE